MKFRVINLGGNDVDIISGIRNAGGWVNPVDYIIQSFNPDVDYFAGCSDDGFPTEPHILFIERVGIDSKYHLIDSINKKQVVQEIIKLHIFHTRHCER